MSRELFDNDFMALDEDELSAIWRLFSFICSASSCLNSSS